MTAFERSVLGRLHWNTYYDTGPVRGKWARRARFHAWRFAVLCLACGVRIVDRSEADCGR